MDAQHLAIEAQGLRVKPCRLSLAEGVIDVEADLHLLEERDAFCVADGDAVSCKERRMIRPERQPMFGRHSVKVKLYATAHARMHDARRVTERKTMQLAITNGRSITDQVEHVLSFAAR